MPTVRIRPVALVEASLAADLMTAAYPREPQDAVLIARHWLHPKEGWVSGRFVAELDGEPAAYLEWQHGPWAQLPERHCWVEVWLDLKHMDPGILTRLWRWIEEAAVDQGARTLAAACGEDEPEMIRALESLDYEHERTERVWTLDLRTHGPRLTAEAEAAHTRMREAGITLTRLSVWNDPDRHRKLHKLNELTRLDVPHTAPILPQTLADFMVRVDAPNTPPDRWWVALDGDDPVATSYLSFPPERGVVWTAYTGCHPRYRGRGIARAVKLQSLAQAVELGVPEVRTDNDSENGPMLHINQTLGYEPMPGYVSFLKRLPTGALR